jgi:hypothetical protein
VMKMHIVGFWVMTPCILVGRYQRFGKIYFLHFQEVTSTRTEAEVCSHSPYFLHFEGRSDCYSEEVGSLFLRNVGTHLLDNTMSLTEKTKISVLMLSLESFKSVSYFV